MEDFDRYGFTKQDLTLRATYSLCRAGWMLVEINGVLENSNIRPEGFQRIQQQAAILNQLQRKFGPPPTVKSHTLSPPTVNPPVNLPTEVNRTKVGVSKLPTLRVINRGIEEAAAVLRHHGWHFSQIRSVLKTPKTPLGDLSFALIHELQQERQTPCRDLHVSPPTITQKSKVPGVKLFIILFWLGIAIFTGVSLILHIL